ncbi:hypothetical protein P8452_20597 [Trifolium repens]|nr:hypothetical protein P8452_20597 [Trifolium repens]
MNLVTCQGSSAGKCLEAESLSKGSEGPRMLEDKGSNNWIGFTVPSKASKGPQQISTIQHELPIERRENIPSQIQNSKEGMGDLQRRLRSDFVNDFFKSITTEMNHLKTIKKHRHEVHNEKLDVFKIKREWWKGFNKYVKEFH